MAEHPVLSPIRIFVEESYSIMNSCLYRATIMHHRFEPKQHRFHYHVFMFYLDLDELDQLKKEMWLLSRNRFNVFNFRDRDHLQLPAENPDQKKNVKEHILDYVKSMGLEVSNPRIMLLTNLCTFGYQFNPVSFYFVYDSNIPQSEPLCCVVEVSNTFREMKPYFLGSSARNGKHFHLNTEKYFYVSPFFEHDLKFDFNIEVPDEKMNIRIDDYKQERRVFISTLAGKKAALTNTRLLWYSIRFPFITVQVITLIHWQAFKLWLKKIPYQKKASHMELQREVYKPYKTPK